MQQILIAKSNDGTEQFLNLAMSNRHGLITGATGTGKTVTLQKMAEQFSKAGVPVFATDVKGDLSGIASPMLPQGCPVVFWDLYGERGHPIRATLHDVGPVLLGRLLNANDVQQGIITIAFSVAAEKNWPLLDSKDFRALLNWMSDNTASVTKQYGNISKTSIGALQRNLLTLESAGGDHFFGEPALNINDFMRLDVSGKGTINILDATTLVNDTRLYSTFLLWFLSELFENLPEVGDLDKPKLVFFFDEAHLLFDNAPKILLDKITQLVRLIRSKGVGVYFGTQNPLDIAEDVLGQLGNRVQHALRAFTPKDQKAVRAAAQTFRQNPNLDTEKTITTLQVGEALVSFLDEKGSPSMVVKTKIQLPESQLGALPEEQRAIILKNSPVGDIYDHAIDRESAYEILQQKAQRQPNSEDNPLKKRGRPRLTFWEKLLNALSRSLSSQLARQVSRLISDILFKRK